MIFESAFAKLDVVGDLDRAGAGSGGTWSLQLGAGGRHEFRNSLFEMHKTPNVKNTKISKHNIF